jgi:fatty acyl-CoA reductase
VPAGDEVERKLHRSRRQVERLRRLMDVYGPYVELDAVFGDREARRLAGLLSPEDRARLPFDPALIDWPTYLQEIHLPALRRLVAGPRPPRRTGRPRDAGLPDGPPALAFFDVDGVVLDSTIAHAYAWLRTRSMPHPDRELWLAAFGAGTPGLRVVDRRSRADLLRRFYERYRHLSAVELRAEADEVLSEFILPRIQQGAVRRVRAHRARGDRVVLLTGALDFLVAPLRHLADDLVAARLVERDGAFTGELVEPPLTAEGRVAVAAELASARGVDLADCHAYGDGVSDLPLLEAVGHPHAVNPDFRLAREARRRRWPVERWTAEPGRRTTPLAPA